jgi:DNA-binding transcriptional MerR regulator
MSTTEVCREAGVSFRQVDYWCRIGLIDGIDPWIGSGARRRFTPEQFRRVSWLASASRIHAIPLGELADLIEQGVIAGPVLPHRCRAVS